jgi:hypothetical protein
VKRGVTQLAAPEQQKSETVVRAREPRLDRERASVAAYRLVELTELRVGDCHVLEDLVIVRPLAEGEPVGRQRGVVIALAFQRECLVEVVEVLCPRRFRLAAAR